MKCKGFSSAPVPVPSRRNLFKIAKAVGNLLLPLLHATFLSPLCFLLREENTDWCLVEKAVEFSILCLLLND